MRQGNCRLIDRWVSGGLECWNAKKPRGGGGVGEWDGEGGREGVGD